MKILEVISILRKDNSHYLWDKMLRNYTDNDWNVIEALSKDELLVFDTTIKKGGCKSKRVIRLSDGQIYMNGKQCYEMNGISKSMFYAIMTGRKPDRVCDFKYI